MKKLYLNFKNDSKSKILNPSNNFGSIALAVYPGIEGYFIRYILECITGITTGSDLNDKDSELPTMIDKGFKGEGLIDNRVWIKKTSYPEDIGQEFDVGKCILVTKNFFELIYNKYEEKIQNTITEINPKILMSNEQLFNAFIDNECELLKEYMDYWLNIPIPLYILRIEDILYDPENALYNLFCFLFESNNLKGTIIENKILTFLKYNKNYMNLLDYHLKEQQYPQIIQNNYTNLQKNMIIKLLKDELIKLGYMNNIPEEDQQQQQQQQPHQSIEKNFLYSDEYLDNILLNLIDNNNNNNKADDDDYYYENDNKTYWYNSNNEDNINRVAILNENKPKSKYNLLTNIRLNKENRS